MKLSISQRLLSCCSFVLPGDRVADVGCDHGYLGIYLLLHGIASSVIASDVNEAPLHSAVIHAEKYGVRNAISFYLSNGVQAIPRDFDCMVCAGMGADTMISIFETAPWLQDPKYRIILQCQSKRPVLRKYLADHGFSISRETLAQDGKFLYPVMEVRFLPAKPLSPWEYYISSQLIEDNSPLFPEYLARVIHGLEKSVIGLSESGGEKYAQMQDVLNHLRRLERK